MTPANAKKILTARRDELLGNLERIEDQLEERVADDEEDAANERQEDEVLTALGQSDQAEMRNIDAALARIADGTYGTCTNCGEKIADKRLDAQPEAALCINCASGANG